MQCGNVEKTILLTHKIGNIDYKIKITAEIFANIKDILYLCSGIQNKVETQVINQAVKNNPDKFPEGYILKLDNQEVTDLKSKILISSWGGRRNAPTAFTESGLYMLATILKSERATQTTIAIIDTFVQLRELARTMQAVTATDDETQKKTLMQRSGELIGEVLGSQLDTTETETEIELNFAVVKIKHKVKKGKK